METNGFNKLQDLSRDLGLIGTALDQREIDRVSKRAVRIVSDLGQRAIGLLVRQMLRGSQTEAAWCKQALLDMAAQNPNFAKKVATALGQAIEHVAIPDSARVIALEVLTRLGNPVAGETLSFDDPARVTREAAAKLAKQLSSPSEIAKAASMMLDRLPPDELISFVEVIAELDPPAASDLICELNSRPTANAVRTRCAVIAASLPAANLIAVEEPTWLAGWVDGAGNLVIAVALERSLTRVATFRIDHHGSFVNALTASFDRQAQVEKWQNQLAATLTHDGYRKQQYSIVAARELVKNAVEASIAAGRLVSDDYWVSRDLLGLGNAHCTHAMLAYTDPATVAAGYVVELCANGESEKAKELLSRLAMAQPAALLASPMLAACWGMHLLDFGDAAQAAGYLQSAALATSDPDIAWNWACAVERSGDPVQVAKALTRFVTVARTATTPPTPVATTRPNLEARLQVAEQLLESLRS